MRERRKWCNASKSARMVGKANHRKRNETVRGTSIYHVDDATRSVETFRFRGVEMYERGAETPTKEAVLAKG